MSFTYEIKEVLRPYDGTLYKMIELKVTHTDGRFLHRAVPMVLNINDGTNTVGCFMNSLSGNQKEFFNYFTIDAFTGFAASSDILFGYDDFPDEYTISGIDVTSITSVPATTLPYQIADNAWLATL